MKQYLLPQALPILAFQDEGFRRSELERIRKKLRTEVVGLQLEPSRVHWSFKALPYDGERRISVVGWVYA